MEISEGGSGERGKIISGDEGDAIGGMVNPDHGRIVKDGCRIGEFGEVEGDRSRRVRVDKRHRIGKGLRVPIDPVETEAVEGPGKVERNTSREFITRRVRG